ncbi:ribosome maturation factor RimM [Pollutimonas nitritireducens]|uniref:Ribosome maturation factor RimM n=1 Tax=Pollutimonas nitritireducens TaxID=2045209 RepID=A0A2N4UIM6_9BURK|nr:ribosome maturation factor RimM [Pollutimonas nitritireducens]PLC54887.1 ribosome maturation factor RimM [Pollutimonas nitritireducens]
MAKADSTHVKAPADLVELGRVVSAYGVRGWVKIQPHSTNAQVLLAAKTWWLKAPVPVGSTGALPSFLSADVLACRPQGSTIVAELSTVADRDHAEAMKGHTVWVPRGDFPSADDDEYYWVDLIGCQLFGELDGQPALIGQVIDVVDNGAHALLRVARARLDANGDLVLMQNDKGSAKGRAIEVLVPFVNAHVHTVDLAKKRLDSNWPVEF